MKNSESLAPLQSIRVGDLTHLIGEQKARGRHLPQCHGPQPGSNSSLKQASLVSLTTNPQTGPGCVAAPVPPSHHHPPFTRVGSAPKDCLGMTMNHTRAHLSPLRLQRSQQTPAAEGSSPLPTVYIALKLKGPGHFPFSFHNKMGGNRLSVSNSCGGAPVTTGCDFYQLYAPDCFVLI